MPSLASWLDIESLLSPFKVTDEDVDPSLIIKHCFTFAFEMNLLHRLKAEERNRQIRSTLVCKQDLVVQDFLLHLAILYVLLIFPCSDLYD